MMATFPIKLLPGDRGWKKPASTGKKFHIRLSAVILRHFKASLF